ncbi:MAG: 50S ribosomal protein L23 [Coriobacteriia bacterium]|nr:50S ribosomal protein L23 [Coriobacteriia bacterium]
MQDAHNVIIRPVVSEKSFDLMEQNKYTFEVAKGVSKEEIKQAIKELFGVDVVKVNTMSVSGKPKRLRGPKGYTRTWKKAIVTLAEGDSIEIFGNN